MKAVPGDLSAPDLGLAPEKMGLLENEIDAILHSAALTSHYGDWEVFRPPTWTA